MTHDKKTLVDQDIAVSMFLESLLRETIMPVEQPVEVVTPVETITEIPVAEITLPEVQVEPAPVEVKPVIEIPVPDVEIPTPVTEVVDEVETAEAEQVEKTQSPVIEETEHELGDPFQALIFKVAGLSLAVPLIELNGVVEWSDKVTEMPGHADFYLGILQHLGKSIPVVDTARLVFPADKLAVLNADKPRERVTHIVLIDGGRWGLACDEVDEVIDLQCSEVKWRQQRSSRRWMAGTVIEKMCALIDSKGFAQLLAEGDRQK